MYNNIRKILESEFLDKWDTTDADIAWDNSNYIPDNKPFVRFSILFSDNHKNIIGKDIDCYRITGFINANIYVKKGTGAGLSNILIQKIEDIFRNKNLSGVVISWKDGITITNLGLTEGWYGKNLSAHFKYDVNNGGI